MEQIILSKRFMQGKIWHLFTRAHRHAYRVAAAKPPNYRFHQYIYFSDALPTLGTTTYSRRRLVQNSPHDFLQSLNVQQCVSNRKVKLNSNDISDPSLLLMVEVLLNDSPNGDNATRQLRDFNKAIDLLAKSLLVSTDTHGIKNKSNQIRSRAAMEVGKMADSLLLKLEYFAYERGVFSLTPTVVTYNSVMHVWAKAAHHVGRVAAVRAEEILDKMIEKCMLHNKDSQPSRLNNNNPRLPYPTVTSFNTVIDAFAKCGESDAGSNAERVLKRMETWSANNVAQTNVIIMPNTHSFSSVIEAHVRGAGQSGRKEAAYRAQAILDEMLSHQNHSKKESQVCIIPKPNTAVFNSVLSAYANSGLRITAAVRAEQILETMLQQGGEACPTTTTFSLIIDCWAKSKSVSAPARAEKLFRRMEELYHHEGYDTKPNKVTFTSLINTWVESNSSLSAEKASALLEQMLKVYEETRDSECAPSVITFNVVLDAWAKSSNNKSDVSVNRIFDILWQMKELSQKFKDKTILPDIVSYNTALNALSRKGGEEAVSNAFKLLAEIESNSTPVKPDINTYNSVLKCLAKSGKADAHEKVSSFLKSLEDKEVHDELKVFPDRISYTILIDAISKSETPNQAELAINVLNQMFELHRLGRNNIHPDVYTYTSVLKACARTRGRRKCREEALRLAIQSLDQMQHCSIEPNSITYRAMLNAICALSSETVEREILLEHLFLQCSEKGLLNQEFLDMFQHSVSEKLCIKMFGSLGTAKNLKLTQVNPLWSSNTKCDQRRKIKKRHNSSS